MGISIRELSAQEMPGIWPLIHQLNPKLTEQQFNARLTRMAGEMGYRCVGAFDDSGALLGISGFWIMLRFWNGLNVDIDNVVVDESARGLGVGKMLMDWIENLARKEGCEMAVLDAFAYNSDAHRFYYREGYIIRGFHFTKDLGN